MLLFVVSLWCKGWMFFHFYLDLTAENIIISPHVYCFSFYWSPKYCSAIEDVILRCLAFLVMMLPVLVTHILYHQPLWFALPCPSIVPWVSPQSTVFALYGYCKPCRYKNSSMRVSTFLIDLFWHTFSALWLSHHSHSWLALSWSLALSP